MRKSFFLLFFTPFTLLGQGHSKSSNKKEISRQLEQFMNAQADTNGFSGTVLVVKKNTILLKKAYGKADLEWNVANTTDTKFGLASVSKQFTAVAILQLVEKGRFSLTDKLSKFFPDYPKGDSVTIHMLLAHTSGLPGDFDELYMSRTDLSKDSALTLVQKKPYLFSPGSAFQYSNIGYFLLACIIEKVSGSSYGQYLHDNLFRISGMINTGVTGRDTILLKRARNYHHSDSGTGLINDPYINWDLNIGHDGIYSTVDDLFKWNKALDGTKILGEQFKIRMFTSYSKEKFGYGIVINPPYNHGHFLLTHDGGFWGIMTSFNRFTKDSIFILVLSNNQSPAYLLAPALSAIVFGIPVELPYHHRQIKADTVSYKRFTGKYGRVGITTTDGKLIYNGSVELLQESPTKFFRADNNDRSLEFITGKDGFIHNVIVTNAGVKETIPKEE